MKIEFKLYQETELPQNEIDDAPKSGPFDDFAEYFVSQYELICSEADAIKYLRSFGAWESDELQDHDTNIQRLVWLAVMYCKENNTNFFYMGE